VVGEFDPAWNAANCLEWIDRSELFLIPLDENREWFRYHHLFQELLQHRLFTEMATEDVNRLHLHASAWFEERGLIDEAVQHALAAEDSQLATHQMTIGLRDVINREDWPILARWLRLLPEEKIQRDPWLLMIRVWLLELTWRLEQQAQVIALVEELVNSEIGASLPDDDLKILRGQILMIRAQQLYFYNQTTRVIEMSREALALLPPTWTFVRGAAILYLGLAMQASGQVLEAERLLLDEYESSSDKSEIYSLIVLQSLGYVYLWTGQLEKAIKIGQVLIQGATSSSITIMKNWGDYYLGVAHYQRNDLEIAEQYFTQIINNHFIAHGSAYRDGVAGLALIHHMKGESDTAWQLLEAISRSDIEQTGAEDSRTGSLRARLQLLQGDLEGARRWVETFSSPPPDQPIIWLEEPQVTRARVLVASGVESDVRMAEQILDVLEEITDRTYNTRFKIEVLALRALALEELGKTTEANTNLKRALELAYPGRFIRVFVDLGASMKKMLHRLEKQGLSVEMIQSILAAYQENDKYLHNSKSQAPMSRSPSLRIPTLAEPLTPRELDILILLQKPLGIKEIAQKLQISYNTAKRHTANIYGKLGVNRRQNAIARAVELGILPPN
jgi:LuxR family maltose regulon positive regulatory protein